MTNYKYQILKEIGNNLYVLWSQMPFIRKKITGSDLFGVNKDWKKFTTRFYTLASKFYSISTKIEDDNQQVSIEVTVTPTINWDVFTKFYKETINNIGNITASRMKIECLKESIQYFAKPTFSGKELISDQPISLTIKYENEEENLKISNQVFEELYELTKQIKEERSGILREYRRVYCYNRYHANKK